MVGQYLRPVTIPAPVKTFGDDKVTIGEALEAAAVSAGEKTLDQSDAAAIQAAEVRATGRTEVIPGGVAAEAQAAASQNAQKTCYEDKTKLGDVLVASVLDFITFSFFIYFIIYFNRCMICCWNVG